MSRHHRAKPSSEPMRVRELQIVDGSGRVRAKLGTFEPSGDPALILCDAAGAGRLMATVVGRKPLVHRLAGESTEEAAWCVVGIPPTRGKAAR